MAELTVHGRSVSNSFDLFGSHENALTLAIGWTLRSSPALLDGLVRKVFGHALPLDRIIIRLQGHQPEHGYTDIEIEVPGIACAIIEAKRGWTLPTRHQLSKYAARKTFKLARKKCLVVLSECLPEYVAEYLDSSIGSQSLEWRWIITTARKLADRVGNVEKGELRKMAAYLEDHTTARDPWNSKVYVVSVSTGNISKAISWIDVVEKKRRYFHPIGTNGWPHDPPTYIGFRYYGKLQSIHFVESHEVVDTLINHIPEITWKKLKHLSFLYRLGKPIRPDHDVPTGGIYASGRRWCAFDLLFTCKTIKQAADLTNERE